MDPSTYARAGAVFEAVCDLPPEDRMERLEELCQGDAALRAQVLAMLEADTAESWLLDAPMAPRSSERLVQDLRQPERVLPERIDQYRILRLLGAGGMGVVYEAEQDHPRRLVALKCLHPWLISEAMSARFHEEAQLMGQLLHPHIPQVYGAGEYEGRLFLAMERVEGWPLSEVAPSFTPAGLVHKLVQVCDAVQHAHSRGVVHCDLKPGNVLVTRHGEPKVLDFGIASAWSREDGAEVQGGPMGTPLYMGPEQLRGDTAPTPAWDVYALGAMAWELLSGRPPHDAPSRDRQALLQAAMAGPPQEELGAGLLNRDLTAVLRRALEPEASRRYPSAAALHDDLLRALSHRPVRARPRSAAYLAHTWLVRNRRLLSWSALPVALVALGVGSTRGARAWLEQQEATLREEDASEHLDAIMVQTTSLMAEGEVEQADALFTAYAYSPSYQGTQALFRAWLARAEDMAQAGRWEAELEALAGALATAPEPADEVVALEALARTRARRWEWTGLGAALQRLEQRGAHLPELEVLHALATRDLPGATSLMEPDDPRLPVLQALSTARPSGMEAGRTWWEDLDGDGRPELFGPIPAGLHVLRGTGELEVLHLPGPDIRAADYLPELGVLVAQHTRDSDGARIRVYPLGPGVLDGAPLLPVGSLEESSLGMAVEADLDEDGLLEVYLGTGPYSRRLWRLDPHQGWSASSPHPATDAAASDIRDLAVTDLDGDGHQELVLASSRWQAWDLRLLQWEGEGLALRARERLGTVRPLVPADTPSGAGLFVGVISTDEQPPEARLLAWDGEHLQTRRAWSLPGPVPAIAPQLDDAWSTDLDGDGLQDIALNLSYGGTRNTLLLRQLPGGEYASLWLGAAEVRGAFDMDGDGKGELLLRLTDREQSWFLGLGEEELPELLTEAPETPSEGDSRALDLLALGFSETAADLSEARTAQAADPVPHLVLAASLRLEQDDALQALALYDQVLHSQPGHPAALRGRARALVRLERYAEAVQAWGQVGDAEAQEVLSWLEPLVEPARVTEVDPSVELDPAWQIVDPLSISRVPGQGVLRVDSWSEGGGDIAVLPLQRVGPRVVLEADLELSELEMGSSLALQIRAQGDTALWWWVWVNGGGGEIRRSMRVGTGAEGLGLPMPEPSIPVDPTEHRERLHLRVVHIPATGLTEAVVTSSLGPGLRRTRVLSPLPEGPCELVISQSRHQSYGSPMHLRADISSIRLEGLVISPEAGDPGRLHLAERDPRGALELLPADDLLARAVARVELGELDQAAALVARALEQGHPRAHALLRRTDPLLGPALHTRLGPAWYDHWYLAYASCLQHPDHPRCTLPLGLSSLAHVPADTPRGRTLLWRRAELALSRGELSQADQDLARLLTALGPDEPSLREKALLCWARVARAQGEADLAEARLQQALRLSPAPELTRDRVELMRSEWTASP